MTEEPQDEWVAAMQENQKAKVESPNRNDPDYTKDRCPCHRCKKIVVELETEIKQLKTLVRIKTTNAVKLNESCVLVVAEKEATIGRLRNLLYAMYANFGHAEIQSDFEILDKVVKELGLKKNKEVKK